MVSEQTLNEHSGATHCSTALPLRAMVLVFEPRLTHSVWQDYGGLRDDETGEDVPQNDDEMIAELKQGVRDGRYVGYRLHRIEREVIGCVD